MAGLAKFAMKFMPVPICASALGRGAQSAMHWTWHFPSHVLPKRKTPAHWPGSPLMGLVSGNPVSLMPASLCRGGLPECPTIYGPHNPRLDLFPLPSPTGHVPAGERNAARELPLLTTYLPCLASSPFAHRNRRRGCKRDELKWLARIRR